MASGKTLERLRQLYSKVDAEVKRWNELQEQSLSLLGTIANIAARLPALEDPAAYVALPAAAVAPGFQQRLLAKQLATMDDLIVQLQGCLEDMQVAVEGMERQSKQAQRYVQQERLPPAARAAAAPPIPSVDACLQGLQEISRMYGEELRLKNALVEEVRYDASDADLRQVAALYAAQPHVDGGRVADLLYVVAATEDRRRL
ncbi:hypothetical protein ABPG77_005952 [Micractinium sp. CCAP 211/92]